MNIFSISELVCGLSHAPVEEKNPAGGEATVWVALQRSWAPPALTLTSFGAKRWLSIKIGEIYLNLTLSVIV